MNREEDPVKKSKKPLFSHVLNVITIALIVECFLYSMMAVQKYAQENCFDRIEETTAQVAQMFTHAMDERLDKLTVFADILASNSENPDALLQTYMENFCRTQYFSAVCIHRANGVTTSYGAHPHDEVQIASFEAEVAKLPYVSSVVSQGDDPEDCCLYQAVPIVRDGKTLAVLYGYMTLDVMPTFIASSAYDGRCQFYVVDGDTGDFLMDEYHGTLSNIYDGSMGDRESKPGYDTNEMCENISRGQHGYHVFRSQRTGEWYYTYYMPLGINNWSMQLTIDEPTAFASYNAENRIVLLLMVAVIALLFVHVLALMSQNASIRRQDKLRLHKAAYINAIERSLINAHNDPSFVAQALKTVAEEMQAETVMLLSFASNTVNSAQYWPSKDKAQAMDLLGRNIRDDFPTMFDLLSSGQSVIYDAQAPSLEISAIAQDIFAKTDVRNLVLVPILDTASGLRGTLAAVNLPAQRHDPDMLECVTYDFFMALTNLENHSIIKKMGAIDYLTGIKNRNSYESEIGSYALLECSSLWCAFVDVNGLHEVNNSQGHKAGDMMLCAVAEAVKRAFGDRHTYRLGGDEFLAFAFDCTREDMLRKKHVITQELQLRGYHISIGFEGTEKQDGVFDVEHIVADAENIMYQEKWAYYQEHNLPSDRGHFPNIKG